MKKILLSFAFLATGLASFAQTVPLNKDWLLKIGSSSLITSHASNGNPSVAYNKVTKMLYLVNWNDKISILNPVDGTLASPSALTTDPGWTEGGKYIKIRVTDDGVIYAINRLTAAGNFQIYRWENEAATPTRTTFAFTERIGDSFGIVKDGTTTRLFVSVVNSTKIFVFNDNGGTITRAPYDIPVAANQARGSISAETPTSIWLNTPNSGSGFETRRVNFNTVDGTVASTDVIAGTKIDWALANTEYFEDGAKKYLVASGAVIGGTPATTNIGLKMRVYDITDVVNPVLKSEGEMYPYVGPTPGPAQPIASSNINGFGDVAIRKNANGTHTFFHVVFGSGLVSYTTAWTLPVSLTSFNAALLKGQSTLTWETASETNNKGFEVLRSTDGKEFTKIDFVDAKSQNGNSSTALSYTYVDRTAKPGTNYYQLNQVDLDGKTELFKDVKSVDVSLAAGVTVFPNPATSYVSVNAGSADFKGVKYELFDVSGKRVLSENAKAEQQDISLNKLPASIYYLKISKNNVVQNTVKLIKK